MSRTRLKVKEVATAKGFTQTKLSIFFLEPDK